jgi:putative ABC transport system permease protein
MFLFRVALRNVLRQYGRTSLSMISIILGVAIIILGRGFVGGSKENIIRAQIDSVSGHVLAVPSDYPDSGSRHPVDNLLSLDQATRAWLETHTEAWTTRTLFTPRIVKGGDAIRARAFGFDPERDETVFPRRNWRVTGQIPVTAEDGVLISKGIGRVLDAKTGDHLFLEVRTVDGAINALDVPVSGVLATGNPMIDRIGLFVPSPLVEKLLVNEGRFSHLATRLADRDDSRRFAAELETRFAGAASVRTWQQETQDLLDLQKIRQTAIDLIALAIMAIAATGIANTVLMAAHERVREIGTLRAMGLSRPGVMGLFLLEGVVMGGVGGLLGALLGGGYNHVLSVHGIDLAALMEGAGSGGIYDNIPMSAMLYTEFSLQVAAGAALLGLLVAVLASVYPALIASRLPPAEAMRAE